MASKKKREMLRIASERGCKCETTHYWFQLRDGTVGCNECHKIIVCDVEYKTMQEKKAKEIKEEWEQLVGRRDNLHQMQDDLASEVLDVEKDMERLKKEYKAITKVELKED